MGILQILLLSLFAGICGVDLYNGQLHIHRPVITGTITGLILGDVQTGLLAGASIEFVWMAMVPLAGAQPPNVVVGGILGTAFTIITKQSPSIAVGIALPFALLGQALIIMFFSLGSIMNPAVDKAISNGEFKKFDFYMYGWLFVNFMITFILVFIPLYFGADKALNIVNAMPGWLIAGMSAIGSIMPAVGFAMLLKIMFKIRYLPFFVLGFISAAYLGLPIIAIAAIACAIAGYDYMVNNEISEAMEGSANDGI